MTGRMVLGYESDAEIAAAAKVIAQLVREGVVFEAKQDGQSLVITFTGGF